MSSTAASALPASAQHIWRVHKAPSTRGRQGKLDPNRRLKVKIVRERRACLRCSMLRIPCSQDDICVPCGKLVEAALHAHEKRTLSFCGCVRTRLGELNLFKYCIPPSHELGSVLEKTDKLALRSITLSFSSLVTWDLSTIVLELVEWLNNLHPPKTSKVGLLSSPNFLDLVEPHVGAEIGVSFQRMLYAESLAYTQPTSEEKHNLSVPELQQIGGIAGHTILLFLDGRLKPDSLRACSRENLEATFLLLVGTILAVGYTHPYLNNDNTIDGVYSGRTGYSFLFSAMQDHLCQILAHFVVFLGSRLSLPIANTTERFILQGAASRWHKEGNFLWTTGAEHCVDRSFGAVNGGSTFCFDTHHHNMNNANQGCDPPALELSNESHETAWNKPWPDHSHPDTGFDPTEVDIRSMETKQLFLQPPYVKASDDNVPQGLHVARPELYFTGDLTSNSKTYLEQGRPLSLPSNFQEFSKLSMSDILQIPGILERYPELLGECRNWRQENSLIKEIFFLEKSKLTQNLLV